MCFGPGTVGDGAKTRLESRIKKFTPHCVCRPKEKWFSEFGVGAEEDASFPGATSGASGISRNQMADQGGQWITNLDLVRAPYVLYGGKCIDPVSLAPVAGNTCDSRVSTYEYQDSVTTALSMANGAEGVSNPAWVGQGGDVGASLWHSVHVVCAACFRLLLAVFAEWLGSSFSRLDSHW